MSKLSDLNNYLNNKYSKFHQYPTLHPNYNEQYEKWWFIKGEELISKGIITYNRNDYSKEWNKFWHSHIEQLKKLEFETQKVGTEIRGKRSRNSSNDKQNGLKTVQHLNQSEDKFLRICRLLSPIQEIIGTQLTELFHEFFLRNAKATINGNQNDRENLIENAAFLTLIKENLIGLLVYDKLEYDVLQNKRKVQFVVRKLEQVLESLQSDVNSLKNSKHVEDSWENVENS